MKSPSSRPCGVVTAFLSAIFQYFYCRIKHPEPQTYTYTYKDVHVFAQTLILNRAECKQQKQTQADEYIKHIIQQLLPGH